MTIVDRQFPRNPRKLDGKGMSNSGFPASRKGRCRCPFGSRIGVDPGTGRGKRCARLSIDNRRPSDGDLTVSGG